MTPVQTSAPVSNKLSGLGAWLPVSGCFAWPWLAGMCAGMSSAVVTQFVHKMAALRVPSDSRVAVALSGGPDSLALAALMAWWSGASASTQPPACSGLQTVPAVFASYKFADKKAC